MLEGSGILVDEILKPTAYGWAVGCFRPWPMGGPGEVWHVFVKPMAYGWAMGEISLMMNPRAYGWALGVDDEIFLLMSID